MLKHGEPLIFGADGDKGIVLDGITPKVVKIGENGVTREDILVHDAHNMNPTMAQLLASFALPDFPVPLGVLRSIKKPVYNEQVEMQVQEVKKAKGEKTVQQIIEATDIWTVD